MPPRIPGLVYLSMCSDPGSRCLSACPLFEFTLIQHISAVLGTVLERDLAFFSRHHESHLPATDHAIDHHLSRRSFEPPESPHIYTSQPPRSTSSAGAYRYIAPKITWKQCHHTEPDSSNLVSTPDGRSLRTRRREPEMHKQPMLLFVRILWNWLRILQCPSWVPARLRQVRRRSG